MKKLLIFGTGKIAEAVSYYFNRDSDYQICGYICDPEYIKSEQFLGKPVFSSIDPENFPPAEYSIFVATGYQEINSIRTAKYQFFKELGYNFASYRSPHVKGDFKFGENTLITDDAVIQPCVEIGNNVFIWGDALIGHHCKIEDNCWLTGSCAVGGLSVIEENTFIGLNATIGNEIVIGAGSMIGAGSLTCRTVPAKSVIVAKDTEIHRLNADQFIRISSCFQR